MAQYNPFFERAGMRKVVERSADPSILRAVKTLESLGFKPYLLSSTQASLEHLEALGEPELAKVREALSQVSSGYYKRLRATSLTFVKKKEFHEWVRGIPVKALAKVISRLAVLAETKIYLFWEKSAHKFNPRTQKTRTQVCEYRRAEKGLSSQERDNYD